jgi:hypothetical protein
MKRLFLLMSFAVLWTCAARAGSPGSPEVARQAASGYEVVDESGKPLPLFFMAAYRAEFRYLQRVFHKFDLAGPGVVTDGWTKNIPEAEWPFMGFCYFGYACAALGKTDPDFRDEALAEMRWLIDALQTPRMSGFIAAHLGEPFGGDRINPSAFVHGHF